MEYTSPFTPERYLKVTSAFMRSQIPESGFFTFEEADKILERSPMGMSGNGADRHDCSECSAWPHCPALIGFFLTEFEEAYPDLSTMASIVVAAAMLFLDFPGPLAGQSSENL